MKTKTCKNCNVSKTLEYFHKSSAHLDGRNTTCKTCRNEKVYNYRRNNLDKVRISKRKWNLDNQESTLNSKLSDRYSITLADYQTILASQNNACAVCKLDASNFSRRLHVDHNHQTGRIRGLLCHKCNVSRVGSNTVESAILVLEYLKSHS